MTRAFGCHEAVCSLWTGLSCFFICMLSGSEVEALQGSTGHSRLVRVPQAVLRSGGSFVWGRVSLCLPLYTPCLRCPCRYSHQALYGRLAYIVTCFISGSESWFWVGD